MKKWIFASVLAATALAASAASAQQRTANPPYDMWCRETKESNRICSAYTYQQCMASRYSQTETCYLNPLYDARFQRR